MEVVFYATADKHMKADSSTAKIHLGDFLTPEVTACKRLHTAELVPFPEDAIGQLTEICHWCREARPGPIPARLW